MQGLLKREFSHKQLLPSKETQNPYSLGRLPRLRQHGKFVFKSKIICIALQRCHGTSILFKPGLDNEIPFFLTFTVCFFFGINM